MRMNRRTALGGGLTAAISGWFSRWTAGAQTRVPDEVLASFRDWSRVATGFGDLPARAAAGFVTQALRSGFTVADLASLDPKTYRGTPIEKRLLEAWYIGVFRIDGADRRNYDTTLMWPAAGIDPSPTTCDGGPQRWASAPSNI